MSNIKNYKYDWIWNKERGTNFLNAKKMPIEIPRNNSYFIKNNHIIILKKYSEKGKKKIKSQRLKGIALIEYTRGKCLNEPLYIR